jgi:putative ABC transport system permease protein
MSGSDPGFRVQSLLTATVELPSDRYSDGALQTQFFTSLKENLQVLPGVESVGVISRLPILQIWGNATLWALDSPPASRRDAETADQRSILPGYFETMEIPLVEGRALEDGDAADSAPVVVLTRRAAELVFADESAVGRQVAVDLGGDEASIFSVVGVVEDHQLSSLEEGVRPAIFFTHAQRPRARMRLAIATSVEPNALVKAVQDRVWELDGDIVLAEVQSMEAVVSSSISNPRYVTAIVVLFSLATTILAALGLYGVLSFSVNQRRHEIGIRLALGASGSNVLRLVVLRGMVLVAAGCVLGIFGAVGVSRLLEGMLFEVDPTDPVTYFGVTAAFVLVALGACLIPARRAQTVDPIQVMRRQG